MASALTRSLLRARRVHWSFAARLGLALALALGASGAVSYVLLHHRLRADAIGADQRKVQADARTFEATARGIALDSGLREISTVLRAVRGRPGVKEAKIVDAGFRVVASGDVTDLGRVDRDARLEATIRDGRVYAGGEADPHAPSGELEYLAPLTLHGKRYAYEVTRSSADVDRQLRSASRTELEACLLGLLLGLLAFIPLGGRLVREHGAALENAMRDGLTRLPNHRAFAGELRAGVARARRHDEELALVAIDVDDFKFVNDRHGHHRGDEILSRTAAILDDGRAGDRAFRTGGDEFVLLLPGTREAGAATAVRALLDRLGQAGIHASAGAADLRPGDDHEVLHQRADAALYEAKRRGGHQVVVHDEIADETSVTSAEAALALRTLLDLDDIECVFQPIWDLREERLLGVEALTRIPSRYDFDGPAEAFGVAERIGRVHDLDVLCISVALRAAARELPDGALLFLNLAPQTLDRGVHGHDWLLAALADAGMPVQRVVIEVTERVGARGRAVAGSVARLREHGLRVALDDVGSGNSALELLRLTHPDFVKLDRSVVAAAGRDTNARAMLLAIAAFASQTGAFVIAEGIEDAETLALITALGDHLTDRVLVDGGQGYGLGRPGPEIPLVAPEPARRQWPQSRVSSMSSAVE